MVMEMLLQEEQMQSSLVKLKQVLEGEIVEKQEPIIVHANLQFVFNRETDMHKEVQNLMTESTAQVLSAIQKHRHNKVIPTQRYASITHAAAFIDVDESFLVKRKGSVFKHGIHFFKPAGQTIVRWDVEALDEWMRSEYIDHAIDDELAELLERR